MLRLLAAGAFALALTGPAHAQPDCALWNTKEFIEAATGADVERCLDAGADMEARDMFGKTPFDLAKTMKELIPDAYRRLNDAR